MSTLTCFIATLLAILTIPALLLWRVTLTPQQNAKRYRSQGQTYKAIGERLGVSATTARRYCLA